MASLTLKTGAKMPLVGFGLWKVDNPQCAKTVYNAIQQGYRLFDSASDYGNEKQSGEGLKKALDDGLVKREDVFITSKLWNTFHAKEHVKAACKKQLADWQLDYFDLYLMHFPISLKYVDPADRYPPGWHNDKGDVDVVNVPIHETWQAIEELVDEGLVKAIGLSNTQGSLLVDVLRYARHPVSVLQIEHHPYLTQEPLVKFAKENGIALTGYSSFGPQSFYELSMGKNASSLLDKHEVVAKIAKDAGKTPAQVLLRWATQRGIAVIPKSNNVDRLTQNLQCTDFDLTPAQLKELSSLDQGLRFNNPVEIDSHLAIFA